MPLVLCAAALAIVLGIVIMVQHSRLAKLKGDLWREKREAEKALKGKAAAQNATKALQDRCRLLVGQLDNSISHTGQALEVARDIAHVRKQLKELTDFVVFPLDTGSGEHRKALPEQARLPQEYPVVQYADPYADPYAQPPAVPAAAVPHRHVEHRAMPRSHPYQDDLPYPYQDGDGIPPYQNGSTVSISGGTYHYSTDKEK